MRKIILTVLVLAFFGVSYAAVTGSADDATVIGGGARPLGMGRAFTAVADDVDAVFINPAGIAGLKGPAAMAMFTNLIGEIYYSEYCGAVPFRWGTVGLGYITTGVNQIPTKNEQGEIVMTDYYDSLFLLSYSSPLSRYFGYGRNIFVGLNYKVFNRGYSGGYNLFASGQSFDFGIKLVLSPYLSFGLARSNILPVSLGGILRYSSGIEESLTGQTKIGVAAKPVIFNGDLLLVCDGKFPAQGTRPVTANFGVEYKVGSALAVRGGFDQSIDTTNTSRTSWSPTFGLSLGVRGFRIDYAYHPFYNDPELATTYLSLSYVGEPWLALKGGPSALPETPERRGRQ
ncbi:MAG: hypothetical protein WC632_08290 [Candidatus Margulisiibacteriota bacterium]